MSSEKGLVITPTEQLPFKCKCYSRILFFFFFFLGWPREISSFPLFLWGEILFVFFLSSRRRVLSLSISKTKERVKEMRKRATGTTPSLFVPFFSSSSSKERVKEREIWVFFFPSSGLFNGNFCSFFGQTRQEKAALLTFFLIRIIQLNWRNKSRRT